VNMLNGMTPQSPFKFSHGYLHVELHIHWIVAVIQPMDKIIRHYDSAGNYATWQLLSSSRKASSCEKDLGRLLRIWRAPNSSSMSDARYDKGAALWSGWVRAALQLCRVVLDGARKVYRQLKTFRIVDNSINCTCKSH
jgi:hypothetical protein